MFRDVELKAVNLSGPRRKEKINRKAFLCWTEECSKNIISKECGEKSKKKLEGIL